MIFDKLNYEQILKALTPVAEAMEEINANSIKVR